MNKPLTTIHSTEGAEDDNGSSGSDNDSAGHSGGGDSDGQNFNEREQQDIFNDMLQ
jgi:hypothetical protein